MPSITDVRLLSWPTHLAAPAAASTEKPKRSSWIQLARLGSFVSKRYGKFSITKDDLKTMLSNFENITPLKPTKLPIDYDHLSMNPQKNGDGVAAGWLNDMELRKDGSELWGEVDWTPAAAERIDAKEYQFVSPSFVRDYVHKDGKKIGTTLIAAAITNHPFLEGMAALSLFAHGDAAVVNLSATLEEVVAVEDEVVSLNMEVGQKVAIKPQFVHYPTEVGQSMEIAEVIGEGEDAFVVLKDQAGAMHRWFKATELDAATLNPNPQQANPNAPGGMMQPQPGVPPVGVAPVAAGVAPQAAPGAGMPTGVMPSAQPTPAGAAAAAAMMVPGAVPGAVVPGAAVPAVGAVPGAIVPAAPLARYGRRATDAPAPAGSGHASASNPADRPQPKPGEGEGGEEKPKPGSNPFGRKPEEDDEPKPRSTHMSQTFKLSDINGNPVELSAEVLDAIRPAVAADSVIVPKEQLVALQGDNAALKTSVTELTTQVTNLSTAAANEAIARRTIELTTSLDALSKAGKITAPQRAWAMKAFANSVDLSDFKEWAATQEAPRVANIGTEHGSGSDATGDQHAQDTALLMSRARELQRESPTMNLSTALQMAAKQETAAATRYREALTEQ